ncbi:MAG: hypothetical protein WCI74_00300 [Actinomycetes bacterium]
MLKELAGRLQRIRFSTQAAVVWAIVITSLFRVVAIAGSYYWQDDFIHIYQSAQMPIGDFAFRPWQGHFEPLSMTTYWLFTHFAPQAWAPALVYLSLLAILFPCLFWSLVKRLGGVNWWTAGAAIAFAAWPGSLVSETWFAAGLEYTSIFIVFCCLWLYAGRRPTRVIWIAVLFPIAVLFNARALVLPLLLVAMLLLAASGPLRSRLRTMLKSSKWILIGLFAEAVVLLIVAAVGGHSSEQSVEGWNLGDALSSAWLASSQGFLSSSAGVFFNWGEQRTTLPNQMPSVFTALLVIAVAIAVGAGLRKRRDQTVTVLVALGVTLLVEMALFSLFRMDFIGPIAALDPRYTPATGILLFLCVASFGWRQDAMTNDAMSPGKARVSVASSEEDTEAVLDPRLATPSSKSANALVAVPFVILLVLGTTSMLQISSVVDGRSSKVWLAEARKAASEVSPDAVFAPTRSPAKMLSADFFDDSPDGGGQALGTTMTLLDVGPHQPLFGLPASQPLALNDFADVRDVEIDVKTRTPEPTGVGCQFPVGKEMTRITMPQVNLPNPAVKVDYLTGAPGVAEFDYGTGPVEVNLQPGLNHIFIFPKAGDFSGFSVRYSAGSSNLCLGKSLAGEPYAK